MKNTYTHQLREILPKYRKARKPKVLVYAIATRKPARRPEDWSNIPSLGLCIVGCWAKWLPPEYQFWGFSVDVLNFDCLQELLDEADEIVSFNGLEFGDKVLSHAGFRVATTFDLMQQVRQAAGQPITGPCRAGYNLTLLAAQNLGLGSTDKNPVMSGSRPGQVSDLYNRGLTLRALDFVLTDAKIIGELYDRRTNLSDPVRIGVRLHCDDRLIDWQEVLSTLDFLFTERLCNIGLVLTTHWSGARIYVVRVSIAESLIVSFPIWLKPKQKWQHYVGLPFKKPDPGWLHRNDPYKIYLSKRPETQQDIDDPIPF